MPSKKFRSNKFYVGDLVEPTWNPKEPVGLGVVVDILNTGIRVTEPYIIVSWQLAGLIKEHEIDIKVVSQAVD
jgi:hypothetical protein